MEINKKALLFNKPIPYMGHTIHQYTLDEITDLELTYYEGFFDEVCFPFMFCEDMVNGDFTVFEAIMHNPELKSDLSGKSYIELIYIALAVFFREDVELINGRNKCFMVGSKGEMVDGEIQGQNQIIIDSNNFEELSDIILTICCKEKFKEKEEEEVVFNSEAEKKAYERLQQYRTQYNKEEVNLNDCDIIKAVIDNTGYDYDKVKKYTLWQLVNIYIALSNKEMYEYNKNILTSGNVDASKEMNKLYTQWRELGKIKRAE